MADTPRGIRNNNPGNIEKGEQWVGLATEQPDERYATFIAPEYGIRAIARILRTYREKYGLTTVSGIISRWAPANENPTDGYIAFVADKAGVEPDTELNFCDDQVADIIEGMIQYENGQQPYDRETILKGIELERTA